jgi:hypothetical protein
MAHDGESEILPASLPLSKRAARRLIQRTFVLVGRDRHIRQHVREASLRTLWVIEDWKFAWSIELDRGKVRFERRPPKRPDLTLTWPTAEQFFREIERGSTAEERCEITGKLEWRKFLEPVCRAFSRIMAGVMKYPFDDEGTRLA